MNEFVFDTYAIIEIIKGNKNYAKYVDYTPIINDFIFFELCYNLLKGMGENKAFQYADSYSAFVAPVSKDLVKEAALFKLLHKGKNLSQTDCVSYMQAKKFGAKFLTGDKQFKGLLGVEFVK